MATNTPDYIIAIGASAGGLEEINTFFDHTPLDGVSYVIVQHLSPDFKSRMVELLSKHSKLVVKEAENGMTVKSNEVYLIPNNKFMTICDNMLFLTYKEKIRGPHLTINRFLNSLAADCGKKAIAVILSGLGSDGTDGIKAINKAGGMVIARNPETSEYSSMPSSAIATGLADFILEPELMPVIIADFVLQKEKFLGDNHNKEKNQDIIINSGEEKQFDKDIYQHQHTKILEEKVNELNEKLADTQAQLELSNENIQLFNEELLSTNEELQSTNLELQKTNEELQFVNKELLALNDDLNNYFRSNVNAQLFVNTDLSLMKFSPPTAKLINLRETDIGRPISDISTNFKLQTLLKDIKQILANGGTITREIETNDGNWYQCIVMPYLQHAGNKQTGAIITFNEITAVKKAQLELDKKNLGLQRINADLDHFVHAASHDLLGPLGNIEGGISIINRKITDPELTSFLTIINSSVKKFRSLIKDIGTIAKLENETVAKELVDLDEVLNNVEWSLENEIKASGAVITRDFEVKQIIFSKKNLRSIVYNLVSNAIKYRRNETPFINIHTAKVDGDLILCVEDNGRGIAENAIDKIFEMYGRLHMDIEGHGIGLYLAKKIINAANGKIMVESEVDKGSKFTICFNLENELPK
jgi:signal transduction histidine kinase